MRILSLNDHLGYADGVWHGHTTYLVNVLPRLVDAGHEVHAHFLRASHPAGELLEAAGVRTRFFDSSKTSVFGMFQIARAALELAPDVVHSTQQQSNTLGRVIKLFEPDVSLVSSIIDFDRLPRALRTVHAFLPKPDTAICVSRAVKDGILSEHGIDAARATVLYNALDLSKVAPSTADARARVRGSLGISADAPVLAMVGRLHEEKKVDELLRAAPRLRALIPDLQIVIAGDGPQRPECERLIRELALGSYVRLLGFRKDVFDVITAADAVAMLCPHEACSFAAIEAFALRCAVLASGAGGLAEMVNDGVSGVHVTPANEDSLVEGAARLLLDDAFRQRCVEQSYIYSRQFSLENHVIALQRIYSHHSADHAPSVTHLPG